MKETIYYFETPAGNQTQYSTRKWKTDVSYTCKDVTFNALGFRHKRTNEVVLVALNLLVGIRERDLKKFLFWYL